MINNGRKPIATKSQAKPAGVNAEDIFGNALGLAPEYTKAAEERNLVLRFISATKLQTMGGYHERGWRPITKKELGCDKMDTDSFIFGSSPDGYVRRGDLILAARPKELNEKHKAYLRQEAQRGKNIQKKHAEELRQHVASTGISASIDEGYDEN